MPDCPASDQILELGCKNLCWGGRGWWEMGCKVFSVPATVPYVRENLNPFDVPFNSQVTLLPVARLTLPTGPR